MYGNSGGSYGGRRGSGVVGSMTGFRALSLAALVLLSVLFWYKFSESQKQLHSFEQEALKYQQQADSLTAQLQVVYEHKSRLERSLKLEKEKGVDTISKLEGELKDSQAELEKTKTAHGDLELQHSNLQEQLNTIKDEKLHKENQCEETVKEQKDAYRRLQSSMDQQLAEKENQCLDRISAAKSQNMPRREVDGPGFHGNQQPQDFNNFGNAHGRQGQNLEGNPDQALGGGQDRGYRNQNQDQNYQQPLMHQQKEQHLPQEPQVAAVPRHSPEQQHQFGENLNNNGGGRAPGNIGDGLRNQHEFQPDKRAPNQGDEMPTRRIAREMEPADLQKNGEVGEGIVERKKDEVIPAPGINPSLNKKAPVQNQSIDLNQQLPVPKGEEEQENILKQKPAENGAEGGEDTGNGLEALQKHGENKENNAAEDMDDNDKLVLNRRPHLNQPEVVFNRVKKEDRGGRGHLGAPLGGPRFGAEEEREEYGRREVVQANNNDAALEPENPKADKEDDLYRDDEEKDEPDEKKNDEEDVPLKNLL